LENFKNTYLSYQRVFSGKSLIVFIFPNNYMNYLLFSQGLAGIRGLRGHRLSGTRQGEGRIQVYLCHRSVRIGGRQGGRELRTILGVRELCQGCQLRNATVRARECR